MNATKILWGQVLLVSCVVLAFLWGATEWLAWRLAFQPQLGRPWLELFGWPVYQPPAFLWWWFAYDAYARDVFVEGAYVARAKNARYYEDPELQTRILPPPTLSGRTLPSGPERLQTRT